MNKELKKYIKKWKVNKCMNTFGLPATSRAIRNIHTKKQ